MRVESLGFDLPGLDSNPFSAIPLEGEKSELYVGRTDIRNRLAQYIKFCSTRRILMVGDLGSGRTSLLRCSALEAPKSVHIDHISAANPGESLLQRIYSELIDYDLPKNPLELIKRMVDYSQTFTESLPLIVIDTPNVEDSVLLVALSDVLPSLERLRAVIVVVVESRQRMNISEHVMHSFDKIETLHPLSVDEVQALIEKRIASVTNNNFTLSLDHARTIHEKTGGLPLEVIKFMRDAIDNFRSSGDNGFSTTNLPLTVNDRVEPSTPVEQVENDVEHQSSDIIDASIPWEQRESPTDVLTIETDSNLFDFDLDLDGLSESQQLDTPVEDFAYSAKPDTDEVIMTDERAKPVIDAGAFGGLLGRTREYVKTEKKEPEEMVNQPTNDGTELWVSKEMVEPEERIDFEEHNSAELIHDEVGFDLPTDIEPEDDYAQDEGLDGLNSHSESVIHPTEISTIISLLSKLVKPQDSQPQRSGNNFIQSLLNLREDKFSEKVDYPLDPLALSSLTANESYILSIAKVRKYSPSDKEILAHLDVKRPRLSQISNKLLKSGILNARMKGRSRYYQLTQSAKAQLIAWGVMESDA